MARGGKRPGAGRPAGAKTKAGADLRAAAQAYTDEAVETIATAMRSGETHSVRIQAASALLDRGHGKAPQALTGEGGEGPLEIVVRSGIPRGDEA